MYCICVTVMIQCEYNATEGGINMSKTETIHVRIDSDLKENAGYLVCRSYSLCPSPFWRDF